MPQHDTGKTYARACTGAALETTINHSMDDPQDIVLFGSCFCPFVQRVWVALEVLGIPYSVNEVDIYKNPKPDDLLEVSPKGLVPALKLCRYHPPRALNESTVIMDYLEDLAFNTTKRSLFPSASDPYARGLVRLIGDHVNRALVPSFYRFLQSQEPGAQIQAGHDFHAAIASMVDLLQRIETEIFGAGGQSGSGELRAARDGLGLWVEGNDTPGWVDIMAGPWLFRANNVLKHYRSFVMPSGARFDTYLARLFEHPKFKMTCSDEDLYLQSYERYAFNRPNTSQVADAINSGRALP
ncbi:glutathione S-transferase [Mucidula mucida]|nr:glutathione S-transferase [Mucidula mucida]